MVADKGGVATLQYCTRPDSVMEFKYVKRFPKLTYPFIETLHDPHRANLGAVVNRDVLRLLPSRNTPMNQHLTTLVCPVGLTKYPLSKGSQKVPRTWLSAKQNSKHNVSKYKTAFLYISSNLTSLLTNPNGLCKISVKLMSIQLFAEICCMTAIFTSR